MYFAFLKRVDSRLYILLTRYENTANPFIIHHSTHPAIKSYFKKLCLRNLYCKLNTSRSIDKTFVPLITHTSAGTELFSVHSPKQKEPSVIWVR